MADIYDTHFVEQLFDEMSYSYEKVNYITSFGFSKRWRRQFIRNAAIEPGMTVCDLMCGMGECWPSIASRLTDSGQLIGLDISTGMLKGALKRKGKLPRLNVTIHKQNALANSLSDGCADCVVSGFGVKTFSDEQKELLVAEMWRILKPGGTFSLVEVSIPQGALLRPLYRFYLKRMIPLIGRIFLGNPENYRMLGVYTEEFGDSTTIREILARRGFEVSYHDYFYGCATGVSGIKV